MAARKDHLLPRLSTNDSPRPVRFNSRSRAPERWARRGVTATLVTLAALAAANPARAAAYEDFDYPANTTHDTWAGGTGFVPAAWRDRTGGAPAARAGSLSDSTGTLLTGGNRVDHPLQFSLARTIGEQPGLAGGAFWVSFLMRRGGGTAGSSGLLIERSALGPLAFFIGEPGSGPGDGSMVISNGNDPQAVSSGVPFEAGRDYFLVARIDLREGNDPATLWVNPVPGVEPTSGGVTFALGDLGAGFPSLALTSTAVGAATSFDELRTGASYSDVAPVVPEPATALPAGAILAAALARRRRRAA